MPFSDEVSSFLSHPLVENTDLERERESKQHMEPQHQAKLQEGLDLNLVFSGMTQGSEEPFVTTQNEICLPAIKGTFKAGVTDSILRQGGEDLV